MNTIESCTMTSPNYKNEECAKLTIDDTLQSYVLPDSMVIGREYTFSCWLLTDTAGEVHVNHTPLTVTKEWTYHVHTFVASVADLIFNFSEAGTYYIYHAQLELGNKATDWVAAPEDVDKSISDTDKTATDANNLATSTEERVSSVEANVGELNEKVDEIAPIRKYIDIDLDGSKPYTMELGQSDSDFKLRLTNTDIRFMEGSFVAAYISNQKLHIDTAVVESELQIGSFVWTEHANGNVGLIWKDGGD